MPSSLQARITLSRALCQSQDIALASDIEAALEAATGLIEQTGAQKYRPQLHEARAELAQLLGDEATHERELHEAHSLYVELGATGHAERLAAQLGLAVG